MKNEPCSVMLEDQLSTGLVDCETHTRRTQIFGILDESGETLKAVVTQMCGVVFPPLGAERMKAGSRSKWEASS
ncbi:hypothetical protein [Georgenia sp. AZ-5]|uniref:hypothetical protein n=1 Tax=Georgenia sp. AZ-5 TaxID=3367526 RepID=UPI0037544A4E